MVSILERLRGGRAVIESIQADTARQDFLLQFDIHSMVRHERRAQDEKWGPRRHQAGATWGLILGEEVGEVNRAVLKQDKENLVDELVQVMAVSSAWIEALILDLDGISMDGEDGWDDPSRHGAIV